MSVQGILAEVIPGHPIQHAMVRDVYVPDTEFLTDGQVRERAGTYIEADERAPVRRSYLCPICRQLAPCPVRRGVSS